MGGKSLLLATESGSTNYGVASTTLFVAPTCQRIGAMMATEADCQITARKSANISRLGIRVNSNGRSTTTTLRVRKNGANGNNVVSVAGGATGYFEDTTNTDTVSSGDTFCFSLVTGTGTGSFFLTYMLALIESGGGATDPAHAYYGFSATTMINTSLNADFYIKLGGAGTSNTDNTDNRTPVPCAGTFSNLTCKVTVNAKATTTNVRFRKNGANGNQAFTVAAGATGIFEDTTNTDTVVNGDACNLQWDVGGTGDVTVTYMRVMFVADQTENATFLYGEGANAYNNDRFSPIGGDTRIATTENTTDINLPYGFTFSRLSDRRSFGAAVHSLRFRKNAANGNLVAQSSGSAGTATVSDNTNSDTTADGDNINFSNLPNAVATNGIFTVIRMADPVSVLPVKGRICLTHGA